MSHTAAPTGTVFVGKCIACKTKYSYVDPHPKASRNYMPNAPYCDCRANVECSGALGCGNGWKPVPHTHPRTAIKWKPVVVTASEKACGHACLDAISPNCVCSCIGVNHGANNRIRSAA